MSKAQKTLLSRLGPIALALALLSTISIVVLRETPADASHGASTSTLDISETNGGQVPKNAPQGDIDLFPTLSEAATKETLILAEIEGGSNDPEENLADQDFATSYGKPDGSCKVAIGDTSCSLILSMPVAGTSRVIIRVWVNTHRIDTQEGAQESPIVVGGNPGCVGEPDRTDVVEYIITGSGGTGSTTRPPAVPGASSSPLLCPEDGQTFEPGADETTGGGPTNTGTPTPTDTGTPTPTDTGTPTPTDTGSPTPTDTGTPTPTDTGTPTPTGPAGSITLAVGPPSRGVWGTDFVISGEVICGGVKVPNAEVTVFRRYVGTGTNSAIETASDVQGRFAIRDTDLPRSADYSAMWTGAGSACPSGAESGPGLKRAIVDVGIIANIADATVSKGQRIKISGRILPGHAGKKVFLQVYRGHQRKWDYASEIRLSSTSSYQFFTSYNNRGYLLFRIAYPTQDLDHGWNVSRTIRADWS